MKTIQIFATIAFALGVLLVAGMGVDLTHSRAGFGMVAMALSCLLVSILGVSNRELSSHGLLIAGMMIGAGYFVWRAFSGGPLGFAVADATIVAIALGSYLVCLGGGTKVLWSVVWALGVAATGNAVMVAIQLSSDSQFYLWREPLGDQPVATGFFGHYNYLSAFLNASVFIFFALTFFGKQWWSRILCGLVVVSSIACVLVSGSRGGWIGFVVGFGVLVIAGLVYLKSRKHPGFGLAAVVSLVALVGVMVTALPVVQELTNRRAGLQDQAEASAKEDAEISDGGRMYFQQMAFEIFQESPVVGSGPRSFSYLALEHWEPEEHSNWNANPVFAHNEFMQVLSDYGLIGFLIVMGLLFGHSVAGLVSIVLSEGNGLFVALKMGALAGLAALGAQSFFSFLVHVPACAMMAGLLLGILALKEGRKSKPANTFVLSLVLCGLVFSAAGLGFLGWRFAQSYLLFEESKSSLGNVSDKDEIAQILGVCYEAGNLGYNPEILESSGRFAMTMASRARESGDRGSIARFSQIALEHLSRAKELNPHSSIALVMVPHVYDMLGDFEKADAGYDVAMEKLWVREPFLKSHLYAAKSKYGQAMMAIDQEKRSLALRHLKAALERIEKRTEILNFWKEMSADKEFRLEIEARIAYLQGEVLYRVGDQVWKEARPRRPELAYALMLEAAERYRVSESVMKPISPTWRAQWEQLQKNVELLKLVGTKPVSLTKEEIEKIINREAVLDPEPVTR